MQTRSAAQVLTEAVQRNQRITVLTGAGISAESGIPTFRGPEGFWTIGSKVYHPQEMATLAKFRQDPQSVWDWYCYRIKLCQQAHPNPGHRALVSMEAHLGDRFTLVTQNVDNLHLAAGSSPSRTLQIHGNIFKTRCASACGDEIWPFPESLLKRQAGPILTAETGAQLRCPSCGDWLRPHVLWFDETYNERHYRFDSALAAANRTQVLITVGTAGATNLPNHMVHLVYSNGGLLIDINLAPNPFADLAMQSNRGFFIQRASSQALMELADAVAAV